MVFSVYKVVFLKGVSFHSEQALRLGTPPITVTPATTPAMLACALRARSLLRFARGVASASLAPRVLFVKRVGGDYVEVTVEPSVSIAALKEAAAAKLRIDASLDAVFLARAGGALLDARLSVDASGLVARDELILTVRPVARTETPDEAAANARITALGAALRAANAVPIADSASGAAAVVLPRGIEWPQLGNSPLFVRSFYTGCVEGALGGFDVAGTAHFRKFAIIGNAGIGKSAFGAFMLWRAVRSGRTVVYLSDKVKRPFIIHADGRGEALTHASFEARTVAVLDDKSTVFICDGLAPPIAPAFTVLLTSPRRERWKIFHQMPDALRLFFPVLARSEVRDMLHACFPHLLTDEATGREAGVWERFRKWGGIARYLFSKLDDDSQQLIESAPTRVNLNDLLDNLGSREIEADGAASHRLLHLKPAGEQPNGFADPQNIASYLLVRSELASSFVRERLVAAAEVQDLGRLDAMLARGGGGRTFSRLYGDIYEAAALNVLLAGGDFDCFDLTAKKVVGKLTLLPSEKVSFRSAVHLGTLVREGSATDVKKTIFVPTNLNYTAVDAVLGQGLALINFTVNTSHELRLVHATRPDEGAALVAAALNLSMVNFYWVLPRPRYDEVCRTSKAFPVVFPSERAGVVLPRIRQLALCVPLAQLRREG